MVARRYLCEARRRDEGGQALAQGPEAGACGVRDM